MWYVSCCLDYYFLSCIRNCLVVIFLYLDGSVKNWFVLRGQNCHPTRVSLAFTNDGRLAKPIHVRVLFSCCTDEFIFGSKEQMTFRGQRKFIQSDYNPETYDENSLVLKDTFTILPNILVR